MPSKYLAMHVRRAVISTITKPCNVIVYRNMGLEGMRVWGERA